MAGQHHIVTQSVLVILTFGVLYSRLAETDCGCSSSRRLSHLSIVTEPPLSDCHLFIAIHSRVLGKESDSHVSCSNSLHTHFIHHIYSSVITLLSKLLHYLCSLRTDHHIEVLIN